MAEWVNPLFCTKSKLSQDQPQTTDPDILDDRSLLYAVQDAHGCWGHCYKDHQGEHAFISCPVSAAK